MRKTLIALCAIVLLFSGCLTVPPSGAVARSATPKPIGPESNYTGYGQAGAHEWSDDDARTLLWLRSNLPNPWADVPFSVIELFRYNKHVLTEPLMPFEWNYYFASGKDPMLQVRMLTLTARDRNNTRRETALTKQEAEAAAAERPVPVPVSQLSNREVTEKLLVIYP